MNGAFYVGATGLQAQQRALDVLAHNIANMNTPSFKRTDVRFSELVGVRPDPNVPRADLQLRSDVSAGVRVEEMVQVARQGDIVRTGNPADLAIDGAGFIELMAPGGETVLWRGGALGVDDAGLLTASNGMALRAGITVADGIDSVRIGSDGIVRAQDPVSGEPIELGSITLVDVTDSAALERMDGGFYRLGDSIQLRDAVPGEDGMGSLLQGASEKSNVGLTEEMVQLMLVQRSYGANAQIMQAADQLMGLANGLRKG